MTPLRAIAITLCAVAAAIAGTPVAPSAQADRPVPFKAGESLVYDVSWTTFLTAGQATLSVKDRRVAGAGRAQYYLVAEGQPSSILQKLYPLYYKAESMLDTQSLRPATATVYSDENGRKRYKTSRFLGNGSVAYEVRTATSAKSTVKVDATAQDPLGMIYVLRALPLKPGQPAFTIPVTDSGKAYRVRVTVGGIEPVKSGIGTVAALKLTLMATEASGTAAGASKLALWLSNDARRLPVKLTADLAVGTFQITLAKVTGS